jgi:chemosensory pili system protein ChpA (sensor histidine kinase/response regulator)
VKGTAETASAHAPETAPEADPVAPPLPTRGKDVRVPSERLDAAVKLVTELLVNQAAFEQNMKRMQRQLEEVHANFTRLSRVAAKMEVQFEASTLGGRQPVAAVAGLSGTGSGNAGGRRGPASTASLLNQNTYGFDALEFDRYTEFHLLLRELTESTSDVQTLESEMNEVREYFESSLNRQARLCRELQEQLMRLRMVPLSTLSARLHRTAHTVAAQRDKLIHFAIEGEEARLDKTVIEEMADPLLHILRNAIDHGIEPPAVREAHGKPRHGSIRLRAFHEGAQTVIQIGDDGGGLDLERLRQKALSLGLLASADAAKLGEQELYSLIFLPGFSTAAEVSEISGRGVGLDVVKSTVQRLKGSVYVDSHPGAGTVFTMRLPMTLAVMRALMVKCNEQTFAVPVVGLSQVVKLTPDVLERLGHDQIVRAGGKVYPLLQLSRLLNLTPVAPSGGTQLALLLTVEDRQVAIAIDETLGGREIVVKNLGNHLRRVHGATGATLLGDGRVVLILNLPELVRDVFRPRGRAFDPRKEARPVPTNITKPPARLSAAKAANAAPATLTVLVVDDSLSVRRVLSNRLTAAGWTALQAKDGLDALEQLQHMQAPPDLMLVDIEMPRMDGYEFISTLRKQPDYAHLPVIVLTSRAGQKHRDRAFEVGATEYLVKPYQDEVLLSLVRRLAQANA